MADDSGRVVDGRGVGEDASVRRVGRPPSELRPRTGRRPSARDAREVESSPDGRGSVKGSRWVMGREARRATGREMSGERRASTPEDGGR